MIRLTAVIEIEGQAPRALTYESNARTIILGRDGSADFQIPLSTVSRQHLRISVTDNVYVIEDLGSTHGTMLNGRKLEKGEKKVLRNGDTIEMTKAKITASIEEEKVAAPEPGEGTQAIAVKAVQNILQRMGEGQGEEPYFRIIAGADEGTRHTLSGNMTEWTFGRSKDCEIVLNDPNVSRRHALLKKDWNGYTVQDLGSKNGVIVNDKPIQKPRRLKDRDEIQIGPIKLLFIDPDAPLMEALKDVPGFATEEPEPAEDEPSVMGAPGSEGQPDGEAKPEGAEGQPADAQAAAAEGGPPAEGAAPAEGEPAATPMADDEPDLTSIDPDLLKPASSSKFPIEWVVIPIVGVIVLGAVGLILLILA